jgi:hypothetical protein
MKAVGYFVIWLYVFSRTMFQWEMWTLGGGALMTPWTFYRRQCETFEVLESWFDV